MLSSERASLTRSHCAQFRRCLQKNYRRGSPLDTFVTAANLLLHHVFHRFGLHHSRCDKRRRCFLRSAWVYVWPEWLLSVISGILAGGSWFPHWGLLLLSPSFKACGVPTAVVCLILFCFCWVLFFFVLFLCLLFCCFRLFWWDFSLYCVVPHFQRFWGYRRVDGLAW